MMMMLMYQWTYHQPSEKSKMFVREKVGGVALTAHNDVSIHDTSRTTHSHTHTHLPILVRWTERTRHSSLVVYQFSGVCMLFVFLHGCFVGPVPTRVPVRMGYHNRDRDCRSHNL